MATRSETFGRLLKAGISSIVNCEGKNTPIIEDELGQQIGVSGDTIQRYKAGHLPPESRTIEILSTAAIRRGFLGREWLVRFLHAARYPFADKLLDQLCPVGPVRPRPPRVYHNLPAPTYSQFVMREQAFADVLEGLGKRSAAVLLVGFGGNGKTSLAREVADVCLNGASDAPAFDAAVWVSDKDRPGTTNLSVVLDEIARTLDYPGFTQFEHDEKRREVEQLLRRQRVLVVVDNFETITDGALLVWLLNLPEPSKALITTREYRREFRRSSWPVDLRGMAEVEAEKLIQQRLRVLQLDKLVKDTPEFSTLVASTGGNPKAIEIALGLIKYERRPLQQVIDDLDAARGELFDDLFTRAWALLDEVARRVLLVTTFFPASASGEALSATADVQGVAFAQAEERLTNLALLDFQQADLNSAPRYSLHPLVRAFANARLVEQPEFESGARERWVEWCIRLASKVGFCWNNLTQLDLLDDEHETVYAALKWTEQHGRYKETILFAKGIEYFYAVRGLLDQKLAVNISYAEAAQKIGDDDAELHARASQVHILAMQGKTNQAQEHLPRLNKLMLLMPTSEHAFDAVIATALYSIALNHINTAQDILQAALNNEVEVPIYGWIGYRRWLATCLSLKGDFSTAREVLQDAFEMSIKHSYDLGAMFTQAELAQATLAFSKERGDHNEAKAALDEVESALIESSARSYRHNHRRNIAAIQHTYARLHILRGDLLAARAAFAEAIDLFERLGMRRELTQARAELAQLDAREQVEVVV